MTRAHSPESQPADSMLAHDLRRRPRNPRGAPPRSASKASLVHKLAGPLGVMTEVCSPKAVVYAVID